MTPVRQALLHPLGRCDWVERFGVEATADPPLHVLVFWMVRVADGFEEVGVAPDSAHVIGRTGAFPFQAEGIPLRRLGRQATLEQDLVFPAVPEVVLVPESE